MRISTRDAARIYRIPARTIRRWHAEGRITEPEMRKGCAYWDAEEIEQMAELRTGRRRLPRAGQAATSERGVTATLVEEPR
ncbi:MerR family transcriptional regulator [Spirillospora sp. NBC_01491]|uniref:MerR family transcriptional regulator n=1 Tax=Spirillospora sp. NBC_01491 TaxID=2976007 RepID=UPI002E32F3E3|nr:MerR family transcriptional regulator [Spirillospora sp. NBC_01491]